MSAPRAAALLAALLLACRPCLAAARPAGPPALPECERLPSAPRQLCYFDSAMELWRSDPAAAVATCNARLSDAQGRDVCRLEVASLMLDVDASGSVGICRDEFPGREQECFEYVWANVSGVGGAATVYLAWRPLRAAGYAASAVLAALAARRLKRRRDELRARYSAGQYAQAYYSQPWRTGPSY